MTAFLEERLFTQFPFQTFLSGLQRSQKSDFYFCSLKEIADESTIALTFVFSVCPLCLFSVLLFSHSVMANSVTPWTAAHQASLPFTISLSLLKLMPIESVMLSNHHILCCPLLFAFNLSQHQGLFQWVGSSHQVARVLELQLQHQSFPWKFRVNFL